MKYGNTLYTIVLIQNVGQQLVHEHYGQDAYLIGCITYSGTVTAASD